MVELAEGALVGLEVVGGVEGSMMGAEDDGTEGSDSRRKALAGVPMMAVVPQVALVVGATVVVEGAVAWTIAV
ncbi:hypothetical protein Ancab_014683 [Ancistrocladus abbreviatus]